MPAQNVAIIIPCFNGAQYLRRLAQCLASVTTEANEIIFVDDGSTDASTELFSSVFPAAKIIKQRNSGVAAARNTGAESASSQFLQFLDVDDVILPGKLEAQVSFAERFGVDVTYSGWQMVVVDQGRQLREPLRDTPMPTEPVAALLGGWWVPPHAYIVRRRAYWDVGGSDPSLVNAQDFDLFVRLAIAGYKFGHAPGHYCDYYRYLNTTSLARGPRRQYWSDYRKAVEHALKLLQENEDLTGERGRAATHKLHSIARAYYWFDRQGFREILSRINDLDGNFKPTGSITYRFVATLVGMENAEILGSARRWVRRGLRAKR